MAAGHRVSDASDAKLDLEIAREVGDAIRAVEDLPPPARGTMFEDVYAERVSI